MGRISIEELDENLKNLISESGKNIDASNIPIQDEDGIFEANNVEDVLKENKAGISELKNLNDNLILDNTSIKNIIGDISGL